MNDESLKNAKKLAILYLKSEIKPDKNFGELIISHPFFESAFMADKNGIFNAIKDTKRYESHLKDWECRIENADSIDRILFYIRKAYRINYIYNLYKMYKFSDEDCGRLLRNQWVVLENNETQNKATTKAMEKWLSAIKPLRLENDEDKLTLDSLSETFTVYRGVQIGENPVGFSWSLKKETAEWFAKRFDNEDAQLCEMVISKKDVVLYTDERGESEIVLLPSKIDSEKITISEI